MRNLFLLMTILILASCSRESLPFSSGALEGTPTSAPASWEAVSNIEIIQFESNPEDPYSVNLWVTGDADKLYIYAGENETNWVKNLTNNPNGKLLANGALYSVVAERVTDSAEFKAFAEAWDIKYGSEGPKDSNEQDAWLYRLTAP